MDIKPKERQIREILCSKKQFEIPRFQREYSWEKKHYQEFLEDMIANTEINGKKPQTTPYFMGTMLFVGEKEGPISIPIVVVDGQQRLTTITILFSALAQIFKENNQTKLSEKIFDYIMNEDDDGNKVRVLKTTTSYPYFSYFIQDATKENSREAVTDEEMSIKETYEFFYKNLQETTLRHKFEKLKKKVAKVQYLDLLKVIRDQILDSTVVEILTTDRKVANNLFEILNAKGKQLSQIDLIKNKIFERLDTTEPADFAQLTWRDIIDILSKGTERTGMATFIRHYWASKYRSVGMSHLYDKFTKSIPPTSYKEFLVDLKRNAELYYKITNPSREAFGGRKEYYWLVQSLNTFRSYFNVVQVRVPLLALIDAKNRGVIDHKTLKVAVCYLENFHFAYTAVLSRSTNRVEPHYSTFAVSLRKATNKRDAKEVIEQNLKKKLDLYFPTYEDFKNGFVELLFSKKDHPCNVKTKYAINKLNCLIQEIEIFPDDGSIEHIIPEEEGIALNIGNLILLEGSLNDKAGNLGYTLKREVYSRSKYSWVNKFVHEHENWTESEIRSRAECLAKLYYEDIFGKIIK